RRSSDLVDDELHRRVVVIQENDFELRGLLFLRLNPLFDGVSGLAFVLGHARSIISFRRSSFAAVRRPSWIPRRRGRSLPHATPSGRDPSALALPPRARTTSRPRRGRP